MGEGEGCEQPSCRSDPFWQQVLAGRGRAARARRDCPLSREQLGHYSWSLLHTIAAGYPEQPPAATQAGMAEFLRLFGEFYPCAMCAPHFRRDLQAYPPRLHSREAFAVWLCETHNRTNALLGKPQFDCAPERLRRRWERNEDCPGEPVLD